MLTIHTLVYIRPNPCDPSLCFVAVACFSALQRPAPSLRAQPLLPQPLPIQAGLCTAVQRNSAQHKKTSIPFFFNGLRTSVQNREADPKSARNLQTPRFSVFCAQPPASPLESALTSTQSVTPLESVQKNRGREVMLTCPKLFTFGPVVPARSSPLLPAASSILSLLDLLYFSPLTHRCSCAVRRIFFATGWYPLAYPSIQ
jgi:hypothetical protein